MSTPDRQPLTAEAEDLLRREIPLADAIAVQLARRRAGSPERGRIVSGRPICAAAAADDPPAVSV